MAPAAATGVTVSYLDPAAPWAAQVGATAGVTRLHAFLATRVALRYDDTAAGIDEQQEFEALYGPLDGGLDLDSETVVDFDDRDFRPDAPAGAAYVLPAAPIGDARFFAQAGKDVQVRLVANRALEIFRNKQLKLASRPGETEEAFLARCDEAGQAKADEEVVKLTKRLEAKKDRLQNALEIAQRRVEELDTQTKSRQANELISGAGAVLGAIFGGKRSARSITNAVGSVASKHGQTATVSERRSTAEAKAQQTQDDLRAARAGDHRRGHCEQRQVEGRRRGHRDCVDQARGNRRPRDRREAGLGTCRLAAALVCALGLAGCSSGGSDTSGSKTTETAAAGSESAVVAAVSDGDTLRTTSGKKIRLLQIDAPELHGDCFGKAALSALKQLTPKGTPITLVRDPDLDQTDRYGRPLRYVIVHGTQRQCGARPWRHGLAVLLPQRQGPVRGRAARRCQEGPRREARLLGRVPEGEAEHRARLDHRPRLSTSRTARIRATTRSSIAGRTTGASLHSAPIGWPG